MTSLPRFSVSQPVLVNMLMIGIIVAGFISLLSMPQEMTPNISFNWAFVTILYPGGSPQEVEDLILIPVERELEKIDHVDEILSTAGEGYAFFLVKFDEISSVEFTAKLQEIRLQVDKADLPEDAEDPIIEDFGSDDFVPVIAVVLGYTGNVEQAARIAEDLKDDIEEIPGVAKIQLSGLEEREIWVEVDPAAVHSHGLTLGAVVAQIGRHNLNLPAGDITVGRSEVLVRTLGRFRSVEDIKEMVLRASPHGGILRLRDVARVRMVRGERKVISRINCNPSITISVSKKATGSTYDVVNKVKQLVAKYEAAAPEGVSFTITIDTTRNISRVLGVLRNNAVIGIVFIFFVLLVFLGISNALLAALGIPISFLITFILMYVTGNTINGSSLFALIVVLGIIVDDAIIIIENVHSHRQRGEPLKQAVIEGTEEVLAPVTSGILTTIAAFVPLMLLPGIVGKFMRIVPFVVSLSLLASLFEATALLPSHIHDWTKGSKHHEKPERKGYLWLLGIYTKILKWSIAHKYSILAILLVALIASAFAATLLGIEMFGHERFDYFSILVKLPEGTALEETDRTMQKIEKIALGLPKEDLRSVVTNAGLLQSHDEWISRSNVGQVIVNLRDRRKRPHTMDELIAMVRPKVESVSGIVCLRFYEPTGGPPSGKPVSIRVTGTYLDRLTAAVDELKRSLRRIPGVFDVDDDFPEGKEEIRIRIDESKAARHGISPRDISMEVRTAIEGLTATSFREGDDDIDVIVKLAGSEIHGIDDLGRLRLATPKGALVPLEDLASIELVPSVSRIRHRNGKRIIMVTADIDKSTTSVDRVVSAIRPDFERIASLYGDVRFEVGGEFEEFSEAFDDMSKLFAIGIILIFLILGTQFKSYIQPLIILTTVPFAFIGAMVGLLISGDKFGIVTLFGVVALAGIVVNDAIVLISFVNAARRRGVERWESIVQAGRQRLRPVILTSVTTIGGLLPTAIGLGGSSAIWRPLASTIAWGLLFSTVLTLIAIPCFLSIVDEIKIKAGKSLVREE